MKNLACKVAVLSPAFGVKDTEISLFDAEDDGKDKNEEKDDDNINEKHPALTNQCRLKVHIKALWLILVRPMGQSSEATMRTKLDCDAGACVV